MMGDGVMQMLAKPIQLADQVTHLADDAHSFRSECQELKSKTDRLAALLRQAARSELYERPARRIMEDTEQILDKALSLIAKCRANGIMKRMFTIIPAGSFRKMSTGLDNSIGDVSWLLRVSTAGDTYVGLPPIAQNEPILGLIWENIAILHTGNLEARSDAAASLVSLAEGNEKYGRLIIEEDGVGHLLRLLKEGRAEGQMNAARALGLLGRDPESVDQMIIAGVCSVFSKVLKESPMKVQAVIAETISELAANNPICRDVFAQNNVVRLLVGHLAFETVEEHSKYTIPPKFTSIHTIFMTNTTADPSMESPEQLFVRHPMDNKSRKNQMDDKGNFSDQHSVKVRQPNITKGRELEHPATKSHMKAMAARALWQLARENSAICKSITESKALLCFSVLLEKGEDEVRYNSAMALMEIARVAEVDAVLRRSAFKPTSPTARSIVDQLLRVIEKADYDVLLVPCITAIGCLSRTFRATEKRIIGPLVRLLDDKEEAVMREAAIALTKFACTDNYLHLDHSKAIINAGGAKHLVQLVYLGEKTVQIAALVLLSYIAFNVPESEELATAEVLTVLEWASKQGSVIQDVKLDLLLPEAKGRLKLYQSSGSRADQRLPLIDSFSGDEVEIAMYELKKKDMVESELNQSGVGI